MKRLLTAVVILGLVLATLTILAPTAEAAWNPAGERGEARFELIPQQGKVHATLNYHIQNLDPDTRGRDSYYYAWYVRLPDDARNTVVYDQRARLALPSWQSGGSWRTIRADYNVRLYYGVAYDFTVEYDLPGMTDSVANFVAYGDTYTATVKIFVPTGYSTELSAPGYTLEKTATHQVFTYSLATDGDRFYTQVSAVRQTTYQNLSGSAYLKSKTINITVNYWEGETSKAQYILDLYTRALPVLEEITAIPFPRTYPIVVKETTKEDIKGYAGVNAGVKGIGIAVSSIGDDKVLLHELAHYWATLPPFGEDWMREGYAELYAYLALRKLGKAAAGEDIRNWRFGEYAKYQDKFTLPLAQWDNAPPAVTKDQNLQDFGYAKSFVFVLGLYDKLGLASLQKFNQEAFASSRLIDWVEFNRILTKVTAQDQSALFVGWVVPGVSQPVGEAYNSWQKAYKAYSDAEAAISKSKGALGIGDVEKALAQARSLLVDGQYANAGTQAQVALQLFGRWQEADKAYRKAVQAASAPPGALGIQSVLQKLDSARALLMGGQYDQVIPQSEAATKLYESWQAAEKAYRQAEAAISGSKGALGMGEVEKALEQARVLLVNGQYDRVAGQAQASVALLAQWQQAEKAYREAAQTIAKSQGALGIQGVQTKLDSVRNLLVTGQYDQVTPQAEAAIKLYGAWQTAEQAYRQIETTVNAARGALGIETVLQKLDSARTSLVAGQFDQVVPQTQAVAKLYGDWQQVQKIYLQTEATISNSKDAPGISVVQTQLQVARDMLTKGQFDQALLQVQATLKLYERWYGAEQSYRKVETIVGASKGASGIQVIESALAQDKELLVAGKIDESLSSSRAAYSMYQKWQVAYKTCQEAQQAIASARQEGRTWRLQDSDVELASASQLLVSGKFEEATTGAQHATERARSAVTPFRALAPFVIPGALAIVATLAFVLIQRRKKARQADAARHSLS